MKKSLLCIFVLFAATLYAQPGLPKQMYKPNIIFIFADDMGYNDLSCYDNPVFKTPNINRLANTGWRFTQAYVNAANCAPSRASLMTGKFTPKHQIYTVGSSERGKKENRKLIPVVNKTVLDTSFYTMPEMLGDAGYECINIGKWHLGENTFGPLGQGFDINIAGNDNGSVSSHFQKYKAEIPGLEDENDTTFLADAMTAKAVEYIKKEKNKPYFLYLPYYSVHTPVQAPQYLIEKYKKIIPAGSPYSPVYAAMMENLDNNVGKIMAAVKEKGDLENTMIVFFSDNGPLLSYTTVNLRGEKGSLYEGGIKEPLIISWPGHLSPGKTISEPVMAADYFPTFAALAAATINTSDLDGRSLVPLFENKKLREQPMIWHFPAYLEPYRKGEGDWRATPSSAIRLGKWKLIIHYETNSSELFDLESDPKEQNDLYKKNRSQALKLKKILDAYLSKTKAFIPTIKNPAYKKNKIEN